MPGCRWNPNPGRGLLQAGVDSRRCSAAVPVGTYLSDVGVVMGRRVKFGRPALRGGGALGSPTGNAALRNSGPMKSSLRAQMRSPGGRASLDNGARWERQTQQRARIREWDVSGT